MQTEVLSLARVDFGHLMGCIWANLILRDDMGSAQNSPSGKSFLPNPLNAGRVDWSWVNSASPKGTSEFAFSTGYH